MATILLYDGNARRCLATAQLFVDEGYEVVKAFTLKAALRGISQRRPDLVVAEWFDSDGPQLIEMIESLPEGIPQPPLMLLVINVPLRVREELERIVVRHGAAGVLTLPMWHDELVAKLALVLAGAVVLDPTEVMGETPASLLEAAADGPIGAVAALVGGPDILQTIVNQTVAWQEPASRQILHRSLADWGSLSPEEQMVRAGQIVNRRPTGNVVNLALYFLAYQALTGQQAQ